MFIPDRISFTGRGMAHWIYAGVIDNLSGRAIMKTLRDQGYKFSDKTMWNDIRQYRLVHERFEAVGRVPSHNLISKDYFLPAKDVTIPVRYLYTYREKKMNIETGEISESYHTAGGDVLETKQDIYIRMGNQTYLDEYYPNLQILEQEIMEVYQGAGY